MSYDIVALHKLIDEWAASQRDAETSPVPALEGEVVIEATPAEERVLPEGQRVVRVKSQGDRVYLLDDNTKKRNWLTTPAIVEGLGFSMADVVEVEDAEYLKYQMDSAIYRLPDEKS